MRGFLRFGACDGFLWLLWKEESRNKDLGGGGGGGGGGGRGGGGGGGGVGSAVEFSVSGFCMMAACFKSGVTLKGLCA